MEDLKIGDIIMSSANQKVEIRAIYCKKTIRII